MRLACCVLMVASFAGACATDDDIVEAGPDGKADGLTRPPPDGTFHVMGIVRGGYTSWESIDGGHEEVVATSGVSGDGYYSWDRKYIDVTVKPAAPHTVTATIEGLTGSLREGVNFAEGDFAGNIGTDAKGFNIPHLSTKKWNTSTNKVIEIYVNYYSHKETTTETKRWDPQTSKQLTVRTRTMTWQLFETGGLPGFHR